MRKGGLEQRERRTICRDKELLSQRLEPAVGWFELEESKLCTVSSFSSFSCSSFGKLFAEPGLEKFHSHNGNCCFDWLTPAVESRSLKNSQAKGFCLVDELRIQIRS